jgi:foldase protein PrsA
MSDETSNNAVETTIPVVMAQPRKSMIPAIVGTTLAIMSALVLFQFLKPDGASAVTNEVQSTTPQAGQAQVQPKRSAQALARVNDSYIGYDEVAQECFSRIGQEVLENIINRSLIQQEVKKRGIVITEAEVTQEVNRIAQKFNLPVDTWYQMLQAERNLTPIQYQRDIIWPKLALQKLAGSEVKISEQDLQQTFVRDYGPRVRCRMIMLDNIRRANEVWEKAHKSPDDFERLAREFSVEPNSKALGGTFPPVSRFSGNQQLEDAAFRLKIGEISGLVQIGVNQFVILKCEGQTEPVVTNINDVKNDLLESLTEEKTQERVASVFETIKKTARVDNFLTNQSSGAVTPVAGQTPATINK